jgi:hypothetical protein
MGDGPTQDGQRGLNGDGTKDSREPVGGDKKSDD